MRIFVSPCEHTVGGRRRCVKRRACTGSNADCCCRVVGLQLELFRVRGRGLALRPTQLGKVIHPHRPCSVHVAEVDLFLLVVGLLNHVVRVRHVLEAKLCEGRIDGATADGKSKGEKAKKKNRAKKKQKRRCRKEVNNTNDGGSDFFCVDSKASGKCATEGGANSSCKGGEEHTTHLAALRQKERLDAYPIQISSAREAVPGRRGCLKRSRR